MHSCVGSEEADNNKWDLIYQGDLGMVFLDHNQHLLRTPRYGPNWESLYTVNSSYIGQDSTHQPTHTLCLILIMRLYYKFLGGNLSKNLEYCPSQEKIK